MDMGRETGACDVSLPYYILQYIAPALICYAENTENGGTAETGPVKNKTRNCYFLDKRTRLR